MLFNINLVGQNELSRFYQRVCMQNYIQPARDRGEREITITAGDVARLLKLYHRVPNICNVLGGKNFRLDGVKLLERSGPVKVQQLNLHIKWNSSLRI